MSEAPDTPGVVVRVERFARLKEPRLRPRFWEVFSLAFWILLGVLSAGLVFWYALSGVGRSQYAFLQCGVFFMAAYNLLDTVGTSLYVRRGAAWGRTLRAFGSVVSLPLATAFYITFSWFLSTWLFVTQVLLLVVFLAYATIRAWRGTRGQPRSNSIDGA